MRRDEAELQIKMSGTMLPKSHWALTAMVTTCFLIDVGAAVLEAFHAAVVEDFRAAAIAVC